MVSRRALGAGCARWAAQTVRAFVDEFVAAMGCRADYNAGLLGAAAIARLSRFTGLWRLRAPSGGL